MLLKLSLTAIHLVDATDPKQSMTRNAKVWCNANHICSTESVFHSFWHLHSHWALLGYSIAVETKEGTNCPDENSSYFFF